MAYIKTIPPKEADGALKEIYDEILSKRGQVAEVLQIQSLNPDSLQDHLNSYMTIMFKKSPLSRQQREMMAVIVSSENGCQYCQSHHGDALNYFWKNLENIELLKKSPELLELPEVDRLLIRYATNLTNDPGKKHLEIINKLRACGLTDKAILDATLVIGYFNFVNRIVQGLGVELGEEDSAKYKYD
ncbi:MAG: peroxidase [Planctomycetota bacterium]|nr:MAG: peroxidase [Planctomycetota bacterium]